jgi:hypothetical protein
MVAIGRALSVARRLHIDDMEWIRQAYAAFASRWMAAIRGPSSGEGIKSSQRSCNSLYGISGHL